jgi:hypothetical protein
MYSKSPKRLGSNVSIHSFPHSTNKGKLEQGLRRVVNRGRWWGAAAIVMYFYREYFYSYNLPI